MTGMICYYFPRALFQSLYSFYRNILDCNRDHRGTVELSTKHNREEKRNFLALTAESKTCDETVTFFLLWTLDVIIALQTVLFILVFHGSLPLLHIIFAGSVYELFLPLNCQYKNRHLECSILKLAVEASCKSSKH